MIIASASDFRAAAKRRLPPFLFHYIDGGSYAETTKRRNEEDLALIALRQRVLTNVSSIMTSKVFFGRNYALPLVLGPIGLSGMYARRGEVQAKRAADAKGVPLCLSTVSICPLAEVASLSSEPLWFQLYVIRDRGFMRELLDRAKSENCSVLMFTVDMPVPGKRYRDVHQGLSGPYASLRRYLQVTRRPRWALDVGLLGRPHQLGNLVPVLGSRSGLEDFMEWIGRNFDPAVTWADLAWIREHWDRPLIIKGVLDPADAEQARAIGADGIVVSNHGGRQLDGVISTARALPRIADKVRGRMTLFVDGGVRTGLDVLRMLALGAEGVLLGRAWAFALAAEGRAGVAKLLEIIAAEMCSAMALAGVTDLSRIDGTLLDSNDFDEG
jgi:L-lactate dehydrogenase (cytochrome)